MHYMDTNKRLDKNNYYLNIAKHVSNRSTCLRRHYGCVIVNNDEIISTGYNGSPRGMINCIDNPNGCLRNQLNIPRGTNYNLCRSCHSEANAIISSDRKSMIGSSLYLCGIEVSTGEYVKNAMPCSICTKLILNSGIESVYIADSESSYRHYSVFDWREDNSFLEKLIIDGY